MRSKLGRLYDLPIYAIPEVLWRVPGIKLLVLDFIRKKAKNYTEECIRAHLHRGILVNYDCPADTPVPNGANTYRGHHIEVTQDPYGFIRIFHCKKCGCTEAYGNGAAVEEYANRGAFDSECFYCGSPLTPDDWDRKDEGTMTYNACPGCGRILNVIVQDATPPNVRRMFREFDRTDPVYIAEVQASNASDAYMWQTTSNDEEHTT